MAKHQKFYGLHKQAVSAVLDGELDADVVGTVFSQTGKSWKNKAVSALEAADLHAAADIASIVEIPFEDEFAPIAAPEESDGSGAKPSHAGSGGGLGKGKNKTKTDTTPDTTTDPSPDPTTEPTPDTTDTSPDPTIEPEPSPTPEPTTDDGSFDIEVNYSGAWTTSQMQAFQQGVDRVTDFVVGDLPDHNGIDDLRIAASLTTVSGGYWGWGGYTSVRSDSKLPSDGYVKLDSGSIDQMESWGLIDDFAFHEILHAMGFGTAWNSLGLVETINGSLRFTGANAIEAYHDEFASIAALDSLSAYGVPVEMDGGSGTAGVHWDEATFGKEIQTGTLAFDNNYSGMTVAALQDMGYETIMSDEFAFV